MKMPGFNIFSGKSKTKSATVVKLTPLGKQKADRLDMPGNKYKVLMALDEEGPCTVHELSEQTSMPPERVKDIVNNLIKSGYISKAQTSEGG